MKWVVSGTSLLAFVFAVIQLVRLVSDVRDRRRQIDELTRVEQLQAKAFDYPAAWTSLTQALAIAESGGQLAKLTGQLSADAKRLRISQEDLAMAWVEDLDFGGTDKSAVLDRLSPVMTRGAAAATGPRKADLLAHVGWASFHKYLGGTSIPDLTPQYRAALAEDPANPYAHAFLGVWIVWDHGDLDAATREFNAAVAANRERPFVRLVERVAFRKRGFDAHPALIGMANDMRKNGEPIGDVIRNEVSGAYWFACGSSREDAQALHALSVAVPPADQVVTYRRLFYDAAGRSIDTSRAESQDACLATLLEAAGSRDDALQVWRRVRQSIGSERGHTLTPRADAAIRRLGGR